MISKLIAGCFTTLLLAGFSTAAMAQQDSGLIARGKYLATAGDCIACHTVAGGKAFAGGLAMPTAVGNIISTNITPSKTHGIGNYTLEEFSKAVRKGVAPGGRHLYPAMPYTAYVHVNDEDIEAMYAYFMQEVEPVDSAPLYDAECASCHQAQGQGSRGLPSLFHNSAVGRLDTSNLVMAILDGVHRGSVQKPNVIMPGYRDTLSDQQIATLGNYVIQHFGNPDATVTVDQVATLRAGGYPGPDLVKMARIAMAVVAVIVILLLTLWVTIRYRRRHRY